MVAMRNSCTLQLQHQPRLEGPAPFAQRNIRQNTQLISGHGPLLVVDVGIIGGNMRHMHTAGHTKMCLCLQT